MMIIIEIEPDIPFIGKALVPGQRVMIEESTCHNLLTFAILQ